MEITILKIAICILTLIGMFMYIMNDKINSLEKRIDRMQENQWKL